MQFYAHQLMRREGGSILPHAAGRLFQQYCVDAYTKMEAQRLHWVRKNQDKLRVEEYSVLRDWAAAGGAAQSGMQPEAPPRIGRPVVLP